MQFDIAYGKGRLQAELPDTLNPVLIMPKYLPGLADLDRVIDQALTQPIDSAPLRERVSAQQTVAIVFSDITRATPYEVILPPLLKHLNHLPDANIRFYNATGTHRINTREELLSILGEGILDRFEIIQHEATDSDAHVSVGTTPAGNEIRVMRSFLECDLKILTGFIEPHFFAGFSGGGKAAVPGLASMHTIMRNHNAAHMDSPLATWGRTEGNPVWEELHHAARMCGNLFLYNITMNRDQEVTGVFAGDMMKAHAAGAAFAKEHAMAPVEAPFDIVITSNSGYPLDLNVYQAVKGMSAAMEVVKDRGIILAAAECWDGVPEDGEFGKILREYGSASELLDYLRQADHRRDSWQAHILARILEKATVYLHNSHLDDVTLESILLKPASDFQATLNQLIADHGGNPSICIIPEGPLTIPYVRD